MNLNNGHKKAESKKIAYDVLEGLKHTGKDEERLSVYAAIILALHDNPRDSWGGKRIYRLIQGADEWLDEMEGYTQEQIKNKVKVKTGIDLR